MSETRHRNAKGQLTSRTIKRNPGPQRPELQAAAQRAAEAQKVAAAATTEKKAGARKGEGSETE